MRKQQALNPLVVIIAIAVQACTPGGAPGFGTNDPVAGAQQTLMAATQESMDPVIGAQRTLTAATQQSLTALALAQQTIAAAANSSNSNSPVSMPITGSALLNDPSIEASSTGQIICSQFEINLKNGGPASFKSISISISVKDDPSSLGVTTSTNGFLGHDPSQTNTDNNCESPAPLPNLEPGASYTVLFPKIAAREGSAFEGSVILCTENDLGGQCSKNSIVFAPHIGSSSAPESLLSPSSPTAESSQSPAASSLSSEIFTADYVNTVHPKQCPQNPTWWVRILLTNRSDHIAIRSLSVTVKDTATGDISAVSDEQQVFVDLDPDICNPDIDVGNDTYIEDLEPNQSFTISSGVFRKDPTEHPMEATLTVCTEEKLSGQCSTKTINFTPGLTAQPTPDTTKPSFPYIILSAGTNCRTGPGTQYDIVGAYAASIKIPVLGKDPAGKYWVVETPFRNDTYPKCWLDGRFVKESGNLGSVQANQVPPTPTSTPKPPTATPTVTSTATATATP